MKIALLIILAVTVLLTAGPSLPICNLQTATQALSVRIFAEQTIDGQNQPILLTRFVHNKLGIYTSELSRCYFNALDPNFIYQAVGIFGLFGFLYFIYTSFDRKKIYLITLFLVIPALPIFYPSTFTVNIVYKIFAIMGLSLLLIKKK